LTNFAAMKPIILVLDDDVAVLSSLQFLLETHGFGVSIFQSAAAMLDWAERNTFDCVVVDYKMPGIDGLQVAERLREHGTVAPVILVTGFPDDSIFIKASAVGINKVLLKPHIEDSLVASIRGLFPDTACLPSIRASASVNILKEQPLRHPPR
jgi:two-component system response regulator FixJ